jgi:hypothetical protein
MKIFQKHKLHINRLLIIFTAFIFILVLTSVLLPDVLRVKYDARSHIAEVSRSMDKSKPVDFSVKRSFEASFGYADGQLDQDTETKVKIVPTPIPLKAIYMTSWVGGTKSIRDGLIRLIDETEINAIVIDIKDYTGKVAFKVGDEKLDSSPCFENRIRDIDTLIQTLKDKDVYIIGRISVFQDPCYVKHNPEVAVRRQSDGEIWKDNKGLTWVDMGSKEAWDYNIQLAKASHALGFDEINFDYVRYPSDGNMRDISFISGSRLKAEVFKDFFKYLDQELRGGKGFYGFKTIEENISPTVTSITDHSTSSGSGITPVTTITRKVPYATDEAFDIYYADLKSGKVQNRMIVSADLFGMTTTNKDDLGIGQILEYALPYVDYVYPMVYPSHYPAGWYGLAKPAEKPYEVIKLSMKGAIDKATAIGLDKQKLRPWLQDFNLGAIYTADMVKSQMRATEELGLDGWLLWNASNRYTRGAIADIR